MRGPWRWLGWIVAAWFILTTAFRTSRGAWTWTLDQCLLTGFAVLILAVAALWLRIWLQGGNDLVRERWRARQQRPAVSGRFYAWSLVFWIAVALMLVVVFNMYQH